MCKYCTMALREMIFNSASIHVYWWADSKDLVNLWIPEIIWFGMVETEMSMSEILNEMAIGQNLCPPSWLDYQPDPQAHERMSAHTMVIQTSNHKQFAFGTVNNKQNANLIDFLLLLLAEFRNLKGGRKINEHHNSVACTAIQLDYWILKLPTVDFLIFIG